MGLFYLLTSPPFPALQGITNGFYNFCLLMTQCLLVPVVTAVPGYSSCLGETAEENLVSPIQATLDVLPGAVPSCFLPA